MTNKLKPGDTYTANGNVYRVYDDGQKLRLWLISQPQTEVAREFDEELEALRDLDATMDAASNRGGY